LTEAAARTCKSEPIRILRIITRLNIGGPARHVVWLTAALADNDFASTLVTGKVPPGEEDMTWFALQHGVTPVVLDRMSREITPSDAITVLQMFRLMLTLRPDVVHTHTAKAGTIGRAAGLLYRFLTPGILIGRPRRCRFIHTYHGHIFHSYYGRMKTSLFLTVERVLARFATHRIIVLSDQQLEEINGHFRVGSREQFSVVPLGIDLEAARGEQTAGERLRAELGIGPDELVIGIIGRLTAIKNHDLFLRVASRLDGARFVVFGDGADRAGLQGRATGNVVFAGTRHPKAIYAATDIVALTSLNEGTPLALIEAMANGLPIVSTAVGGVVDLLGPIVCSGEYDVRERGITVKSNDDAAFAAALQRVIGDRELRDIFAARGPAFVEERYSRERLINDIQRLTREVGSLRTDEVVA
jgi:glycosyltransferase involved in cell wall biosynthesis